MSSEASLSRAERRALSQLLVRQAANAPPTLGARGYLERLIRNTNWRDTWKVSRAAALRGDPYDDAERLIDWAVAQGTNPLDSRYTVLGGLLEGLIEDLGLEDAQWVAALIVAHGLFRDERLLDNLRVVVPRRVRPEAVTVADHGPDIDWRGPTDERELQSLWSPELDYLDHRDLRLMLKRAECVCRIQFERLDRPATGFLIADDLLLTSYHVFEHPDFPDDDFDVNLSDAKFYFGKVRTEEGQVTQGQPFEPRDVLARSRWDRLDYVLIRVEERIKAAPGVAPAPYELATPRRAAALHLIGHPGRIEGEAMQFALSSSGVTAVDADQGYIQYWTRAAGGSSGSPCFNEDWKVVAIHHAQRATLKGTRREGILLRSIYPEISRFLPVLNQSCQGGML